MKKVKKAVIPVAGLGTRFLPATKTVPKELFPIVDKPILLFIIEEVAKAGIEDVILIQGRGKTAIENFFDTQFELESTLKRTGKSAWLETLEKIKSLVNVISIRQKEALGLGHAVLCAEPAIGNEPFAVLLGDELMMPSPNNSSLVTEQLVRHYTDSQISMVAVMEVAAEEVSKYGIIDGEVLEKNSGLQKFKVRKVVEKPKQEEAPSRFALPGRYVFDSRIFSYLKNTKPGVNGEIQLTDGMTALAQNEGLMATTFTCKRYDAGDKFGYLQANIEYGLQHPEVAESLKRYLKSMMGKELL